MGGRGATHLPVPPQAHSGWAGGCSDENSTAAHGSGASSRKWRSPRK